MTEVPGDPFDEFLASETARVNDKLVNEASVELLQADIAAKLEAHGLYAMWHPDKEEFRRRVTVAKEQVRSTMGEPEADDSRDLDQQVAKRAISEQVLIATIGMILVAGAEDSANDIITQQKKGVLARMKLDGFDEAWQTAVSDIFGGVNLDITTPEDSAIFFGAIDQQTDPLVRALSAILLNPDHSPPTMEIVEQRASSGPVLLGYLYVAQESPEGRANAEEYIYGMERQGLIDQSELPKLLALLDIDI